MWGGGGMKKCLRCKAEKPKNDFYFNKSICKICDNIVSKEYMQKVKSDAYLLRKFNENRKAKYELKKSTWHLQPDRKCKSCGVIKPIAEYYFNFYKCKPCTLYEKFNNYHRYKRAQGA